MNQMQIDDSAQDVGRAAARAVGDAMLEAITSRGSVRVIFASAPSQESMLGSLARDPRIEWERVRAFHMDEYLVLDMDRPQAFGRWLEDRLPDRKSVV